MKCDLWGSVPTWDLRGSVPTGISRFTGVCPPCDVGSVPTGTLDLRGLSPLGIYGGLSPMDTNHHVDVIIM